jgi:6-pyruvoyltetrahydropterin/6-carboxytetrahydropterin synthase
MDRAYLTRRIGFSAAHRYHRPEWSEAENRRVFGACANPVGHGHNYVLDVTIEGRIDPVTGFAVDLAVVDELLRREVHEPLDHQHLNHAVAAFGAGGSVPTTENILVWLWPRIAAALPAGSRLHRLRLAEEPGLYVDYYGGGPGGDRHG